ncbi:MAG: Gfo/Idh/MocA family oxidoreductase [Ruminococcaceae bacterium]|nr:Gfo/Idh/MocA family oxidoreductase [Oscillospiraceae bacterium]
MEKKILNVGVISCSGMAEGHMKGVIAHPQAKLVAVCDIDLEKAKTVAERRGVDRVYQDYRELLAQPDIDAVIIVTPDHLHREMAVAALEAGKHVLCEKPLALNREDIQAIADATKKTDKKFMVGQICRYTPGFKAAKEIIDRGEIGELVFVETEYAHNYEKILEACENWESDPARWRSNPERNGVVGGGCHAVDFLRWIVGEDPEEVRAYSTKKIFTDMPYDDTHIAIMKFPNGVMGKVFVSVACKRNYTMRSVFYGTKGTIIVDNKTSQMTLFREDIANTTEGALMPNKMNSEIAVKHPIAINNHNAAAEFEEFADIVLNDKPVGTTVYEGAKTVAACFAIVESAKSGQPVKPDYNF